MKKALIILAGVLVFTACKKKAPGTNCYEFFGNDSITSNVPIFNNPHGDSTYGKSCALTDDQRNFRDKEGTYTDTVNKHDTMIINHWVTTSDFYE